MRGNVMGTLKREIGPILRISFLIMIVCGFLYPVGMTGIAQVTMNDNADGSLIYNEDNELVGSELIGQHVTDPKLFHGRLSAIEFDASGSGSNNYAPSNEDMIKRTSDAIEAWTESNPDTPVSDVPIDLVTDSGSGLDPHISPEGAYAQVNRISTLTGLSIEMLNDLIEEHTEGRDLGLFGEPRVNVLKLNLDLIEKIQ